MRIDWQNVVERYIAGLFVSISTTIFIGLYNALVSTPPTRTPLLIGVGIFAIFGVAALLSDRVQRGLTSVGKMIIKKWQVLAIIAGTVAIAFVSYKVQSNSVYPIFVTITSILTYVLAKSYFRNTRSLG